MRPRVIVIAAWLAVAGTVAAQLVDPAPAIDTPVVKVKINVLTKDDVRVLTGRIFYNYYHAKLALKADASAKELHDKDNELLQADTKAIAIFTKATGK